MSARTKAWRSRLKAGTFRFPVEANGLDLAEMLSAAGSEIDPDLPHRAGVPPSVAREKLRDETQKLIEGLILITQIEAGAGRVTLLLREAMHIAHETDATEE